MNVYFIFSVVDQSSSNQSEIISKLNTSDLSLNSSRTRRRKESFKEKFNNLSSSSEENSPQHHRRWNGMTNTATNEVSGGNNKTEEWRAKEKSKVSEETKQTPPSNTVVKNRSDSFVLDVNSIMSSIMVTSGSEDDKDEVEEKPSVSRRRKEIEEKNAQNSSRIQSEKKGAILPNKNVIPSLANKSKTNSISGSKAKTEDTVPLDEKYKDLHYSMGIGKTEPAHKPAPLRKLNSREEFNRDTPQRFSKDVEKEVKADAVTSQREDMVLRRRTGEEKSRDNFENKQDENVVKARSRSNAFTESQVGSPNRSNDRKLHPTLKVELSDESLLPDSTTYKGRPISIKEEMKRRSSSGSFKLSRSMSGDKALGMFYHNRRSQLAEHENAADDHGSTLERSGSYIQPQSPPANKESFNSRLPDIKATQAKTSTTTDMNAGKAEVADRGSTRKPSQPLLTVPCDDDDDNDDDESEVSVGVCSLAMASAIAFTMLAIP